MSHKDFKKRRREEDMDDREQKRRRSDHDDRSRSYYNSRSNDKKTNNNNHYNRQGQNNSNNRNPPKNYTDRNNNSAYSPKNNRQPQYRKKEYDDHNRNIEKKEFKKKITIHLVSDSKTQHAGNNKTLHFNFVNNNNTVNPPNQTPQQPKVSSPSTAVPKTEPAPPLAGYYYDPDINRYFKVPPTGTVMYKKYQEALKKAEEKDRKQKEENQQREEKERLARGVNISILSDKYKSPLSTIIRREAGRSQRPKEFMW